MLLCVEPRRQSVQLVGNLFEHHRVALGSDTLGQCPTIYGAVAKALCVAKHGAEIRQTGSRSRPAAGLTYVNLTEFDPA